MSPGQWISAGGHGGLIAWVLLGGIFSSEPPELEVTEVSVISSEAFDALVSSAPTGQIEVDLAALTAPAAVQDDSPLATETEPPSSPDAPSAAAAEPASETPQIQDTPPASRPELIENAPPSATPPRTPEPQPPQPEVREEPPRQLTSSARPRLRPENLRSERIAPQAAPTPAPEARPDPVPQQEVAQTPDADTPRETEQAQAPDAAAPEQTEAPAPAQRLATSLRPRTRPAGLAARPAPPPQPERQTTQNESNSGALTAGIDAALAQANGSRQASQTPALGRSGPPLTQGEESGFLNEIKQCWNLAPLSSEALNTSVVVAWDMQRDGRPVAASIRMIGSTGGSPEAAEQAFQAARRAVQRCGASGYNLPTEKFNRWRQIEVNFNPENMSVR